MSQTLWVFRGPTSDRCRRREQSERRGEASWARSTKSSTYSLASCLLVLEVRSEYVRLVLSNMREGCLCRDWVGLFGWSTTRGNPALLSPPIHLLVKIHGHGTHSGGFGPVMLPVTPVCWQPEGGANDPLPSGLERCHRRLWFLVPPAYASAPLCSQRRRRRRA